MWADRIEQTKQMRRTHLEGGGPERIRKQREKGKMTALERIEYLLMKQGGHYQSSTPFTATVCGGRPRRGTWGTSWGASENQLTLFPP